LTAQELSSVSSEASEALTSPLSDKDGAALGTTRLINTLYRPSTRTSRQITSQQTLLSWTQPQSQIILSCAEGSPAKPSASQESEEDLRIREERSFLKSCESLGLREHHIYSLRTSRDCLITTRARHSRSSCGRWMNAGMMRSGRCLTARISESRRIGRECSLSDILETNPHSKYFLSREKSKKLLTQGIWRVHSKQSTGKGTGLAATLLKRTKGSDCSPQPNANDSKASQTDGLLEYWTRRDTSSWEMQ